MEIGAGRGTAGCNYYSSHPNLLEAKSNLAKDQIKKGQSSNRTLIREVALLKAAKVLIDHIREVAVLKKSVFRPLNNPLIFQWLVKLVFFEKILV